MRFARVALMILFFGSANLAALDSGIEVSNRFSAQGAWLRGNNLPDGMAIFAWRPELFGAYNPRPELRLSAEMSVDNRLELLFQDPEATQTLNFKPYRAWVAAAWENTELKAGLQHIRMGVAQIYRPLQWFDNLDPGAFLQDSKGVLALNLSHFFPNPELRLWVLPGMGETLETQAVASRQGSWEYGGRVGVSSLLGETGLSFDRSEPFYPGADTQPVEEYRFGLDQRVDGWMGGWLEAELSVLDGDLGCTPQNAGYPEPRYRAAATLGGDYTFGLGNGLYSLAEISLLSTRDSFGPSDPGWLHKLRGGMLLNYPLGLFDTLVMLGTYNEISPGRYTVSMAWRRSYDKLSWDLSLGYDSANPLTRDGATALGLTINYDI